MNSDHMAVITLFLALCFIAWKMCSLNTALKNWMGISEVRFPKSIEYLGENYHLNQKTGSYDSPEGKKLPLEVILEHIPTDITQPIVQKHLDNARRQATEADK